MSPATPQKLFKAYQPCASFSACLLLHEQLQKRRRAGATNTNPTDTARYALPCVTRLAVFFSPRPELPGRGPLFILHPARRPEQQTKDRQQRQDKKASHAANSFTLAGVCAVSAHGVNRVTKHLVYCGEHRDKRNQGGYDLHPLKGKLKGIDPCLFTDWKSRSTASSSVYVFMPPTPRLSQRQKRLVRLQIPLE